MSEKTVEQKFLDAFKLQYKNEFNYDEYPNELIRMWFMQGYELAQKEAVFQYQAIRDFEINGLKDKNTSNGYIANIFKPLFKNCIFSAHAICV